MPTIKEAIERSRYPTDAKGRALVPMKDQRTATICATDGPEGEELVGWYSDSHLGRPAVCSWQDNGCWQIKSCSLDLLPPPPRKVRLERWAEIVDRVVVAYHHEPIAAGEGRIVVPFVLEYEESAS